MQLKRAALLWVLLATIVNSCAEEQRVSRKAFFTDFQQDARGEGLEIEVVHEVKLRPRQDGWSKAMYLPDDARHLGQSLGYTLREYPTPHAGILLASLSQFTVGEFGIICNTSHSFSVFATAQKVGDYEFDNTYCPTNGDDVTEVEKGLLLLCPYGGSWQHFMQDLLYKVAFTADALRDEAFSIILESETNPAIHSVIRTMFGRDVDFVTMDSGCIDSRHACAWHVHAKTLLVAEAFPVRADLGWPPARFLRLAATKIGQSLTPDFKEEERRLIVNLGRGKEGECDKSPRCVRNDEELHRALAWIADLSASLDSPVGAITGLDAINLDRKTHTLSEAAHILRFAAVVVSAHGGQTYNMVFAKPGTIFIEFVPTKPASGGPYSVHNFVSALGHKHWLLPVPTSTHIIHDDANPFVVDVRKVIRILLLEMAVLPLELLGLTFQVAAVETPLDASDQPLCLAIHWEASNLDIAIQDWCQGRSCLDLFLLNNGKRVSGLPIGPKAACHTAGVLSECVSPGLFTFQLEVCTPWRAGYDCVKSDIARVDVKLINGEKKMRVVQAAGPMKVSPHCAMASASGAGGEGWSEEESSEEKDDEDVEDACVGREEECEKEGSRVLGDLDVQDLPPHQTLRTRKAEVDPEMSTKGNGQDEDSDEAIEFKFLDVEEGKIVFPYRLLIANLQTLGVGGSFPKVFVCVSFEADRECYEVDATQTRSEVPLTIPEHILKLPRDYEASAFLATQESDPTQFLPVGIETGPMLLAVEPKLCVVVPFRDGCHGRQQGKGRAHNKQVFLKYMLRFLGRARRNWEIIVAEQTQHGLFNKGILFNVGAWVGEKQRACDYFTLHDVDQVPTNPQNDYAWKPDPTHMCTYSTQYTYAQWPPPPHVGGVLMSTLDDYKEMNGYSNKYHGWGLEDNDQYWRLVKVFDKVERLPQTIGHYRDLPHERVMGLDMTENYNESQRVLDLLMASHGTSYTDTDGYAQILQNAQIEDLKVRGKVVTVTAHVMKDGLLQGPC